MKAPAHLDADGRARMCVFAQSLLVLAQGVPFIHAGDDLLRSKSLDRDSYNSGAWGDVGKGVGWDGGRMGRVGGWVGWVGSNHPGGDDVHC
jgi:hypothetical protein